MAANHLNPNFFRSLLAVNGRYRYAHIFADSGERALIGVHNCSEEPILFVRYYPVLQQRT